MRVSLGLSSVLLLPLLAAAAPPPPKNFYHPGDLIGVTCLNRSIDNGEHVSDPDGHLQYIPFPPPPLSCSDEPGSPATLRLPFLSESLLNCTIPALTDELYHLLEFYVHADSPLSCRIPRRPPGGERDLPPSSSSSDGEEWIPLVISLTGKIERSHIHISNHINLIVHISPDELDTTSSASNPGMVIDSAAAYSVSPLSPSAQTKIIPGDPLPLLFTLRWYPTPLLPRGTVGSLTPPPKGGAQTPTWAPGTGAYEGGHVTIHTVVYCLLSCLATAILCTGYFRAWEFPKRLRRYGYERQGLGPGVEGMNGGGVGGRVGYGYGVGVGLGLGLGGYGGGGGGGGLGKKD
ncbi:hypothetical protein BGX38DRAFT_1250950 [Terfezia claveryi]|nr:hypothetical protein BGX38DRAFT_1250950 [Terfezia claveryi]